MAKSGFALTNHSNFLSALNVPFGKVYFGDGEEVTIACVDRGIMFVIQLADRGKIRPEDSLGLGTKIIDADLYESEVVYVAAAKTILPTTHVPMADYEPCLECALPSMHGTIVDIENDAIWHQPIATMHDGFDACYNLVELGIIGALDALFVFKQMMNFDIPHDQLKFARLLSDMDRADRETLLDEVKKILADEENPFVPQALIRMITHEASY